MLKMVRSCSTCVRTVARLDRLCFSPAIGPPFWGCFSLDIWNAFLRLNNDPKLHPCTSAEQVANTRVFPYFYAPALCGNYGLRLFDGLPPVAGREGLMKYYGLPIRGVATGKPDFCASASTRCTGSSRVEGKSEFTPVNGHDGFCMEICRGLHGFFGHHMNGGPVGIVLAGFQDGEIERAELFADQFEVRAIAGITADIDFFFA